MSARDLFLLCLAILALWFGARWLNPPVTHPPGVLVAEQPRQAPTAHDPFWEDDVLLTPRAEFSLRARVLGRERYWLDGGSGLAPVDLALGWGPMSDQAVLDQIEIRQGGRWYFLRWESAPPVAPDVLMNHSGNMHIIPSDSLVNDVLNDLRPGHVVALKGWLVDASRDDGWTWSTSLSREDRGDGSCELFYVVWAEADPS